jgi:hypothetical protein
VHVPLSTGDVWAGLVTARCFCRTVGALDWWPVLEEGAGLLLCLGVWKRLTSGPSGLGAYGELTLLTGLGFGWGCVGGTVETLDGEFFGMLHCIARSWLGLPVLIDINPWVSPPQTWQLREDQNGMGGGVRLCSRTLHLCRLS